jgi:trehalose-phosphatase
LRDVRTARHRALLLDYDGTLAPFQIDPARAEPYPGVREAIATILAAGHTRLAIVTGRAIRDLVPLLRLDPLPTRNETLGIRLGELEGTGRRLMRERRGDQG